MKVRKTQPKGLGVLLKGLQPILTSLDLEYLQVAEAINLTPVHLSRLAKLRQGTGQRVIDLLSGFLCCKDVDLMSEPTPVRLAQIVADYDEAKAKRSRAAARQLEKQSRAS